MFRLLRNFVIGAACLLIGVPSFGQALFRAQNGATAAAPTFTVNTAAHNFACSATTCTVTMTLTAGHTYTAEAHAANAVTLQSASSGGTWLPYASCASGNTNAFFSSCMVLISASSGSNPVFTFSGNDGTGTTMNVRDVTATGGTPAVDFAHASLTPFAATTTATGETPVVSGTAEYIAQTENNDAVVTTTATVYGNKVFDPASGGWADQNGTGTTPPVWGWSGSNSGNANTEVVALEIGGTACADEAFIDGTGGTNGTTVTAALITSSEFGYPRTGANNGGGITVNPATGMTFVTGNLSNLHTSVHTCDGVTHTNSGGLHFHYDLSTTTNKAATFAWLGSKTLASAGFFYQTSLGNDSNQYDQFYITMSGAGGINFKHVNNDVLIECFGGATNSGTVVTTLASNTLFWVTMQINTAVGGSAQVYETSTWTSVGSGTCTASGWTASTPAGVQWGRPGAEAGRPAATSDFAGIRINAAGTYPLGP